MERIRNRMFENYCKRFIINRIVVLLDGGSYVVKFKGRYFIWSC